MTAEQSPIHPYRRFRDPATKIIEPSTKEKRRLEKIRKAIADRTERDILKHDLCDFE